MIMQNDTKASENEIDEGVRRFNNILRAAQSRWGEFFYDCTNKIARGVLTIKSKDTYIGELSYNDMKDCIFLTVRIAAPNAFAPARTEAFQRFMNDRIGLGHVTLDREDQIVNVRAATAVSKAGTRHAVESIFVDTFALLEDEDLQYLLT
jgi:hypothetical protein